MSTSNSRYRLHAFWFIEPRPDPILGMTDVQVRVIDDERGSGYSFSEVSQSGEKTTTSPHGDFCIFSLRVVTIGFLEQHLRDHPGYCAGHILVVGKLDYDHVSDALQAIISEIDGLGLRVS